MFESFVSLSEHIHELRSIASGRPAGNAMRFAEVWQAALDCPRNGITEIRYFDDVDLPDPMSGIFVRLLEGEIGRAAIYIDKSLETPFKEFAAIKELMHCWSPGHTYVGNSDAAKKLMDGFVAATDPYSPDVSADRRAILAAYEVILPSFTVDRHLAEGQDFDQIALRHDLDIRIVKTMCRHDILHARRNGTL